MLDVFNIEVKYEKVILVVKGVSLTVSDGSIITLLGANGASKSTVLKSISGLLKSENGAITQGTIKMDDVHIEKKDPEEIINMGIIQIMEGRRIFKNCTLYENVFVGANLRKGNEGIKQDMEMVFQYFPMLRDKKKRLGGYLSGGEQQMVVIGRALMGRPKLLLMDEPSLGLAPVVVKEIFKIIHSINKKNRLSILLVEQNVHEALRIAQYGYVMENGRVVLEGAAEDLAANEDIREFYLGLTHLGEKKGFKGVKHYKRRKRWMG
jgi:branched-chain amino acid transport system ATP-binding protein